MAEPLLLGQIPARAARRWGRRTALFFKKQRLTFRQFHQQVERMRGLVERAGIRPGERVAVALDNSPAYAFSYFAVPGAGAILVPLNTFLAPAEVERMLADSQPAALIVSKQSLRSNMTILERLDRLRCVILCDGSPGDVPDGLPASIRVHCLEEAPPPGVSPPMRVADPGSVALIIYTSGTTGDAKGVMLTHANLITNARGCIQAARATARDRVLVPLPLFHSFTQMVGLLAPLLAGMSIVLCSRLDRVEIKRQLLRTRPTIFPAVPSVFSAMAHVRMTRLARWMNPIRLYISGGAPLSLETLRSFEERYRRPLCEGYGLSEASPVVCLNPPSGRRKLGSVGPPLPGIVVRAVDAAGRDVPRGQTGELIVRGPSIMRGYLNRERETRDVLRDGWLRTGDQGRIDEDGCVFIMGRNKDMLISRGMNIYPREIEGVLESHPSVDEAAVVGVDDDARGEVPYAFVTLKKDLAVGVPDLRRLCLEKLARYKVPRGFQILEGFPHTSTGKVLKRELRARITPPARRSRGARAGPGPRHES